MRNMQVIGRDLPELACSRAHADDVVPLRNFCVAFLSACLMIHDALRRRQRKFLRHFMPKVSATP
jgi:hypothetical protein